MAASKLFEASELPRQDAQRPRPVWGVSKAAPDVTPHMTRLTCQRGLGPAAQLEHGLICSPTAPQSADLPAWTCPVCLKRSLHRAHWSTHTGRSPASTGSAIGKVSCGGVSAWLVAHDGCLIIETRCWLMVDALTDNCGKIQQGTTLCTSAMGMKCMMVHLMPTFSACLLEVQYPGLHGFVHLAAAIVVGHDFDILDGQAASTHVVLQVLQQHSCRHAIKGMW